MAESSAAGRNSATHAAEDREDCLAHRGDHHHSREQRRDSRQELASASAGSRASCAVRSDAVIWSRREPRSAARTTNAYARKRVRTHTKARINQWPKCQRRRPPAISTEAGADTKMGRLDSPSMLSASHSTSSGVASAAQTTHNGTSARNVLSHAAKRRKDTSTKQISEVHSSSSKHSTATERNRVAGTTGKQGAQFKKEAAANQASNRRTGAGPSQRLERVLAQAVHQREELRAQRVVRRQRCAAATTGTTNERAPSKPEW